MLTLEFCGPNQIKAPNIHYKAASLDLPTHGVSPTRPSILFIIPPVDVAQAMFPSLSTATAPTVPILPLKHMHTKQLYKHTHEQNVLINLVAKE